MMRKAIPSAVTMAALILSATGCTQSPPDPAAVARTYEEAVDNLAEDKDVAVVEKALETLYEGKLKAFPTLVAHVNDPRRASGRAYMKSVVSLDGSGPTIGMVCLDVLQMQVEGNWPKAFQPYYYLRSKNVASWWEANKDKPLDQLRIEAAESALDIARQGAAPADVIRFLEKHLKDVGAWR